MGPNQKANMSVCTTVSAWNFKAEALSHLSLLGALKGWSSVDARHKHRKKLVLDKCGCGDRYAHSLTNKETLQRS